LGCGKNIIVLTQIFLRIIFGENHDSFFDHFVGISANKKQHESADCEMLRGEFF
jgi:hypothetical protein